MSKKSNEESLMQMLRKEIKNLKEENKELKEKILVIVILCTISIVL
ncbi:hypothetical protein [uncultured Clostridium sp.]|nr:hypothetical protein [uncultured Clostridium sp.]